MTCTFVLLLAFIFQPIGLGNTDFEEVIGDPLQPGTFSIGTLPAEPDPEKPVIVFVQGLTNNSTTWYEDNDMYSLALEDGYETAFVELYDSGGEPKSYWDNGEMLAQQLEDISNYFLGKTLAVVGYSKGGIDAQVALIHEGKHHLVSDVVTIGSPHHGSELADLANSFWAGWLANLIGANSEGTQSLQTGVMNNFRAETDFLSETELNNYYTIAGENTGSWFSSYWWGSQFISGPSDGVVSVESAHLPYGDMLAIGDWNHGNVHYGSNALPIFKDHLTTEAQTSANSFDHPFFEADDEELDLFIRGGEHIGTTEETFFVENNVEALTINWMSSTKLDAIELVEPGKNNETTYDIVQLEDQEFFNGAWHHMIEIDSPQTGEWVIRSHTEEDSAYLLLVNYDSSLNHDLTIENHTKGWRVDTGFKQRSNTIDISYRVDFAPGKIGENKRITPQQSSHETDDEFVTITDQGEGTYNVTIDIEGTTPSGDKFQRTSVQTIYLDENGNAY